MLFPDYYFLKINFNIFLPSTPMSSKWSISIIFSNYSTTCLCITYYSHSCCMPPHLMTLLHKDTQFCTLVLCSMSSPNILPSSLLRYPQRGRRPTGIWFRGDKVSHLYKTTGNITVTMTYHLLMMNRRYTSTRLHGITSHKTAIFMVLVCHISNFVIFVALRGVFWSTVRKHTE